MIDRPIRALAESLRRGEISAVALTEATLERIAARDPALHAFVHLDAEGALQAAARIDDRLRRGEDPGPLAGIPLAVKDLMDVAGMPGHCGSHAFDPRPARRDAALVARLRQAGAVILGKLATYEFALTGPAWDQPYPPARNPWNRDHVTGGSSSGSAAAVAGGLLRAAIGTDTGGSIRSPASYCGVVGLKPTRGRVPEAGVFPLAPSLDVAGPLAACVGDAALVLDAIAGTNAGARLGRPVAGMRIGYARDWFAADPGTQPAVLAALDDAVSQLSLLGVAVDLVDLPDYDLCEAAGCVILQAEALQTHLARLRQRGGDYGRDARRNLITGAVLDEADLAAARALAMRLGQQMDEALAGRDALVTATTLQTAPAFAGFADGAAWTPMRTLPFNLTGHPAISLPCGMAGGLPIGMQIVGRHRDEAGLCQLADAFEAATLHGLLRPPPLPCEPGRS